MIQFDEENTTLVVHESEHWPLSIFWILEHVEIISVNQEKLIQSVESGL